MPRYIDEEGLKQEIRNRKISVFIKNELLEILSERPTADVKKVVHGKFEKIDEVLVKRVKFELKCPFCKAMAFSTDNFCANCGADMRGD